MVVSGFVKDYTIQKYHGEMDAPSPVNNSLVETIQDEEFDRIFDAYYDGGGVMMVSAMMMGLVDSMMMMSMTGISIVIVVMMNLMMMIS